MILCRQSIVTFAHSTDWLHGWLSYGAIRDDYGAGKRRYIHRAERQLFTCHTRRLTRNTCLSTWRDPCGSQWHARLQPVTRQPVLPARLCSLGSDYCSYAPVKYSYSLTRVLWKCGTVKWRNKFGVKPEGGKCGTGKCRTTAVEWPMVL